MKTSMLILIPVMLLTGCVGSGEGGAFTPQDGQIMTQEARDILDLCGGLQQMRNPQRYPGYSPAYPAYRQTLPDYLGN